MPVVTLKAILCIQPATGTDLGPLRAVAEMANEFSAAELGVANLASYIKHVPEIVAALDAARNDPDDLYVTTVTEGDVDQRIWPKNRKTVPMRQRQVVTPMLQLNVDEGGLLSLSLWDWDPIRDDLLAAVTISAAESGEGEKAKRGWSDIEGSVYYVIYEVN